jgi:hypothetical protein
MGTRREREEKYEKEELVEEEEKTYFNILYFRNSCSIRGRAVIAQSVWRWTTGWTIEVLGFDSRRRLEIFLFTTASRTDLGPTQPPIQWVPGTLSLEVKRPGREADHSPPSSAEVKECVERYLHSPIRLHGLVLS